MNVPDFPGYQCVICHDTDTGQAGHDLYQLECGHAFGRSCIATLAERKMLECPFCRRPTIPPELPGGYTCKLKRLRDVRLLN